MLTAAANITDLMDDDLYLDAILHNFGLSAVAVTKFTDNYSTDRDLMLSNKTQIKDMINQNKKCIETTLEQTSVVTSTPPRLFVFWHFTAGKFLRKVCWDII